MPIRILALALVVVSVLSGCASLGIYKGLAMATCNGPVTDPRFRSGSCMTGAEYNSERKKAQHSLDKDEKTDPRYKDWIP